MKKLISFVLLLALAFSLAACAAANQAVTDVDALEEQVTADWIKKKDVPAGYTFGTFRYYGTDNGYHIIFFTSQVFMAVMSEKTIAGYTFSCGSNFSLYAYKNGRFIDLKTANFFGLVSDEAIAKAAELHASGKNATE